jgi:hypothetical protein
MIKVGYKNEIDIKAFLAIAFALLWAWSGKIDWIVAALFCLSNMTLIFIPKKKSEEVIE